MKKFESLFSSPEAKLQKVFIDIEQYMAEQGFEVESIEEENSNNSIIHFKVFEQDFEILKEELEDIVNAMSINLGSQLQGYSLTVEEDVYADEDGEFGAYVELRLDMPANSKVLSEYSDEVDDTTEE